MEGERKAAGYIDIGARVLDGRCLFTVWAPSCERVELKLPGADGSKVPMERDQWGYWHTEIRNAPGRYLYLLNRDLERPDPASHHQPDGVHGASALVDHETYRWHDEGWRGVPLEDFIIYEIHVGTFTPEGTFEAVIPRLPALSDLGITAVELMPVSAFPGKRNWGYDGVYPFAVQSSYGGPAGLKRLIDACHAHGLAVILDVVYNHLGPEGNYFADFGPYFTGSYRTFWGEALSFDQAYSSEVRNYFVCNMLHWFERYHVDGLRLDAVHAIFDRSAVHFLEELSGAAEDFDVKGGTEHILIAESDLNDPRIIRPRKQHGYGMDAQWSDDFHHALHTLLTGERAGYYEDFGSTEHLRTVFQKGFYHTWRYSAYRKRFFGADPGGMPGRRFVVCTQNHDQVGNRPDGKRLGALVSFEALKLAAAALLLSPFVPLLFMGQEYAEDAPFLYFLSQT
jgi:maltooligosyltrehalose trehalohydrolase